MNSVPCDVSHMTEFVDQRPGRDIGSLDQALIEKVFQAIATTRKTGKVAESILITQLQKWNR